MRNAETKRDSLEHRKADVFVFLKGQKEVWKAEQPRNNKMNNTTANHSIEEEPLFGFEPTFVYPVATCYILIVAVAIVGNLLVCYAILANRNLRHNPTNLLLLSLAVSDLLTVSLAVPFDIEGLFLNGVWKHGKAMCITWTMVYLIAVPTSILTLLAISVDRYKTLSDPLGRFRRSQFLTPNRALIVILILWLYSIFWAFLGMGWLEEGEEPIYKGSCMLPFTKEYTAVSTALNWIFPLLITCLFYILIYLIARKHHKFTKTSGLSTKKPSKEDNKRYLKNVKAAKTTAMFVMAFFICWIPYSIFSIVSNLDGDNWEEFPFKVYVLLLMLGYLNSALNPFLFAFRNKRFKAVYAKLFRVSLQTNPSLRRRSTFSQSTSCAEIPENNDNKFVRLQSIKAKRESPKCRLKKSKNQEKDSG